MAALPTTKEKLWFYVTNSWYTGKYPNFHDVRNTTSTQILEGNYEAIKKEVLEFYDREGEEMKPNFTPYNYSEEGWRTLNLMSFMLKYPKVIEKFPTVWSIVSAIPDVVTVQVAVLRPNTRIKAHFGDSNAIVRSHLGLVIPGKYPDLGLRNGSQEQCWEEGKVFAITIAHRHYAWNYTDKKRIILLVDTIHPDFRDQKTWVCSMLLAAATLKVFTTKMPKLKRVPTFIPKIFQPIIATGFYIIFVAEEKLKFDFGGFFNRFKVDL